MKRKFPFWATLLTLTGAAILASLGTWQLDRLAWKEDLLARLDAAYAVDASRNPLLDLDWKENVAFTRGVLTGTYINDGEVLIAPRTHEGRPGYHVLTPLHLAGDRGTIMVNRGWIPLDQNNPEGKWSRAEPHEVTITGMVRETPQDNIFVPQNNPAKDAWYRIDLDEIAHVRKLENLIPYVFYAESQGTEENGFPLPAATKIRPANNHKQYALFWYTMAFLLVMMYALRFLRRCS